MLCAQVIAGGNGSGRTGGADVAGQAPPVAIVVPENLVDDRAGHLVVPDGVAEFLELVEDDDAVAAFVAKLPALVVDFLDVRFGAGRGDDLVGADFRSHSKRSRLMPSGRMATAGQASRAQS